VAGALPPSFLIGMMVLAEFARREGLVGTAVTIFLSNDATAVVLTPAVYAAAWRAVTAAVILFA
jgi:arsenical pump membrane protein